MSSGIAINGVTYTENYLAKKLVPYIWNLPVNTHQYIDQNIKFGAKSVNPPNIPEIRCNVGFWGLIKGKVTKMADKQKTWISYELGYLIVIKSWSRMRTEFSREDSAKNRHDQKIRYCIHEIMFFLKDLEKLYFILFILIKRSYRSKFFLFFVLVWIFLSPIT